MKKGISLIVLVITIIVIIILAGAIILSISKNNPINSAVEATYKANLQQYQNEYNLFLSSEYISSTGTANISNIYATKTGGTYNGKTIQQIITSMSDVDAQDYIINKGKLIYVGSDTSKKSWTSYSAEATNFVKSGLVAWYDGSDFINALAPSVWVDRSGNNNHAKAIGFNYTTSGSDGNGNILFDGTDDAFQLPITPNSPEHTFALAFKRTDLLGDSWGTLFGGPSGYEIESKDATSKAFIDLYNWGGLLYAYNLNEWVYITFVKTTANVMLYVNGELKLTSTSPGATPNGLYFIGAWVNSGAQNYKGYMSDFMLYNRVLTQDEITQNYNAEKLKLGI